MFPFLTLGFPLSYFSLYIGLLFGTVLTFFTISLLTFVIVLICIYSGIIRITPFFSLIHKVSSVWFPKQEEYIKTFAKKMFQVKVKGEFKKQPYILCFHPHGAFSVSYFFHRTTTFTDWPLRGGKSCVLRYLYWLPFGEEILDTFGAVSNRYMDMKKVLEGGETLSVIPGGIREMYDTEKGKIRVKIRDRSGIFRLAIETETPLVPVITYGENELYELSHHPYLKRIQEWLSKYDCILPIPSFETIKRWIQFVLGNQKNPLVTVIGNPIEITKSHTIDSLREDYILALQKLYKETKPETYDSEMYIS
jgi:hypothetical protein